MTRFEQHVDTLRRPLGTVRVCKHCGHTETVKASPGAGRGYGMREGNKARGRMIQHLKDSHPDQWLNT